MSQTPEARIRLQYQALRRRESGKWGLVHERGVGAMWLLLARQWRRPVQEIKRICRPSMSQGAM